MDLTQMQKERITTSSLSFDSTWTPLDRKLIGGPAGAVRTVRPTPFTHRAGTDDQERDRAS
jgi:hypothetical protein